MDEKKNLLNQAASQPQYEDKYEPKSIGNLNLFKKLSEKKISEFASEATHVTVFMKNFYDLANKVTEKVAPIVKDAYLSNLNFMFSFRDVPEDYEYEPLTTEIHNSPPKEANNHITKSNEPTPLLAIHIPKPQPQYSTIEKKFEALNCLKDIHECEDIVEALELKADDIRNVLQEKTLNAETQSNDMVKSLRDEISDLNERNKVNNNYEQQIMDKNDEILSIEEENLKIVQSLSDEIESKKSEIEKLKNDLSSLNDIFTSISATKADYQSKIDEVIKEKNKIEQEKRGLISKLNLLTPRLEEHETLLQNHRLQQEKIEDLTIKLTEFRIQENTGDLSTSKEDIVIEDHVKSVVLKKLLLQYFSNKNQRKEKLKLISNLLNCNNREQEILGLKSNPNQNQSSIIDRFTAFVEEQTKS